MTGCTHAAAGALAGALASHILGHPVFGAAIGSLAAVLPDIDHPGSILGRQLRGISVLLEALVGHRTICHTVWFALLVAACFAAAGSWLSWLLPRAGLWWGLPALAGALSHLILDATTRTGLKPFEPLPVPGRLAHPRWLFVTGTWWQEALLTLVFLALTLIAVGLNFRKGVVL